MTNEELIRPRYMVIADYPGSFLSIRQIIVANENGLFQIGDNFRNEVYLKQFPHIFQKVGLWEGIKESDMPKYLKFIWDGKISEVQKKVEWLYAEDKTINGFTHEGLNNCFPRVSISGWLPATEEEYTSFKKSLQLNTIS